MRVLQADTKLAFVHVINYEVGMEIAKNKTWEPELEPQNREIYKQMLQIHQSQVNF